MPGVTEVCERSGAGSWSFEGRGWLGSRQQQPLLEFNKKAVDNPLKLALECDGSALAWGRHWSNNMRQGFF